jgi:DNA-directed RNA polymerase specialized sigma24 family protein
LVPWKSGCGLRILGGHVDNPVGLTVYQGETLAGGTLQDVETLSSEFTRFVTEAEPRLSYAFFAAYGPEVGADVTSDSLTYAWEHWNQIREMENPIGYLFRVGQSKARWYHRPRIFFLPVARSSIPDPEPKLPEALSHLTRNQRVAVVLVHAMDWTEDEVARLIGRSRSTVRTHLERGLLRLRDELEVKADV